MRLSQTDTPLIRLPDLQGKVAIITGDSAGIGKATLLALLDNGVTCFGLSNSPNDIQHSNFRHYLCNLAEPDELKQAMAEIKTVTPRADFLVNAAGIDPRFSLADGELEQWDTINSINLRAYYLMIKECLPLLRCGEGRSIVNLSSINYRLGVPGRSIYAATKAGILGLTTGLARELGSESIRINTVSPGWTLTERQMAEYFSGENADKNYQRLSNSQALQVVIQPSDIANHVLFYLSAVSRASTGHNCVVDAGWLLE